MNVQGNNPTVPAHRPAENHGKAQTSAAQAGGTSAASAKGGGNGFLSLLAAFGAEDALQDAGQTLGQVLGQAADALSATQTGSDPSLSGAGGMAGVMAGPAPQEDPAAAEVPAWLLAGQLLQGRLAEGVAGGGREGGGLPGERPEGGGQEGGLAALGGKPGRARGRALALGLGGGGAQASGKETLRQAAQEAAQAFGQAALAAKAADPTPNFAEWRGGNGPSSPVAARAGGAEQPGQASAMAWAVPGGERGVGAGGAEPQADGHGRQGHESGGSAGVEVVAGGDGGFSLSSLQPGGAADAVAGAGGEPAQASAETQIAEQVRYWISNDVQNAELTLDPWGTPVDVAISVTGNEARVEFRSDEGEVRSLLEGALTELRDMLRDEGLVLSGVSVGASGADGRGARERDAAPERGAVRRATVSVPTAAGEGPAAGRVATAGGRAVDMFV